MDLAPKIVVPPPGPKAMEILRQDIKLISPSYTRAYPLVAARGEGAFVFDPDGNVFLDFTAGLAVLNVGHCHPRVVAAVAAQTRELIHMSGTDFYNTIQPALAERLAGFCPGPDAKKVYFGNSGTEAVEAAVKLARHRTGRQYLVAFYGAFHGRTCGALSLTASKTAQRRRFSPLLPGVVHVPYAYCYRCPLGSRPETCSADCAAWIEEVVFRHEVPPEEVAAVAVEPVLGEGGYVVPPPKFLRRIEEICRRYGILLVADEVQTGMGRTGKMLAVEHSGVVPDIVTLAKAIASGLPLSATVAPAGIMTWPAGSHASTFGGNPVACAAAMATLDVLDEGAVDNAADRGKRLFEGLHAIMARHALVGDVRGLGLMVGVELVRDRRTKERAGEERNRLVRRCFEKGLLVLPAGECTVRFSPPLNITSAQVDTGLALFEETLAEVAADGWR